MTQRPLDEPEEPPRVGTVLRYRYLWMREFREGQSAGNKARPAAVIVARSVGGETIVLPITHAEPDDLVTAIEVPPDERRRIGLDGERSWIIVSEINAFVWPGQNLQLVPDREPQTVVYGRLSKPFFTRVLFQVQTLITAGRVARVGR